jgi:hypothetical protein
MLALINLGKLALITLIIILVVSNTYLSTKDVKVVLKDVEGQEGFLMLPVENGTLSEDLLNLNRCYNGAPPWGSAPIDAEKARLELELEENKSFIHK